MHPQWLECLEHHGGGRLIDSHIEFGPPAADAALVADADAIVPLPHLAVIDIHGEERQAFLQGQLTSDTAQLEPGTAQWTAYCSPKGRVLSNGILAAGHDHWHLWLSAGLSGAMQKRLSMFVLRAKAKLASAPDSVAVGAIGDDAIGALAQSLALDAPARALSVSDDGQCHLLRLEGARARAMAWIPVATACAVWPELVPRFRPAGSAAWQWLDIAAGQPWVDAATSEHLIPQSLNLDLLTAVNFKKGCYVGQEIVARTAYLGTVKRRMFHVRTDAGDLPPPATDIRSGDQVVGEVVTAALNADGGLALLVSARRDAAEAGTMALPDGRGLTLMPLPYPLP